MPGLSQLTHVARLSGGASQETWALDAIVAGATLPLILRRTPGGQARATGSGTSVPLATEAIVIETCREAGVAAPRVRCVLTPEDGIGDGYVMDRLPGETIARKILRDSAFDAVRPDLARQCGEALARIHKVDIEPLRSGVAERRRAGAAAALPRHLRRL